MAIKASSGKENVGLPHCGQCGWQAPPDCGWNPGDDVFHCEGGTGAWRYRGEVHHLGYMLHDPCWRCGRVVGCLKCAGIRREALCMACAAWTTVTAFVAHGAIVNTDEMVRKRHGLIAPQFDDYPEQYRKAYLRAHGEKPKPIDPKKTFRELVGFNLPR